jgi:hypothetical protein
LKESFNGCSADLADQVWQCQVGLSVEAVAFLVCVKVEFVDPNS